MPQVDIIFGGAMRRARSAVAVGIVAVACGPGAGDGVDGSGSSGSGAVEGSDDAGQTSTTGEHPLGWSCGDGVIVTGEYCFRELTLENVGAVEVALGDLDGDGRAEIVVQTTEDLRAYAVREDDTIELLQTWGGGESSGVKLWIGDFDGDERTDVMRCKTTCTLFAQQSDASMLQVGMWHQNDIDVLTWLGMLDADLDGHAEMAVFKRGDGMTVRPRMTTIELRDGQWHEIGGGFEFWLQPEAPQTLDIDRDGVEDLAVLIYPRDAMDQAEHDPAADGHTPVPEDWTLSSAFLGRTMPDGSGLALGAKLTPGFYPGAIELGDLDGDGHVDAIVSLGETLDEADDPPQRVVFWGRGDWQFDGPHDAGDAWGWIRDRDGDGVAELWKGSDEVSLYSAKDGAFATVSLGVEVSAGGASGQINADGVVDFARRTGPPTGEAVSDENTHIVVYLSDP